MGEKCPFCNIEHDEVLDKISEKASQMAESMDKESLAKMMFHTGATQMLVEHLMNEYEGKCKNHKD